MEPDGDNHDDFDDDLVGEADMTIYGASVDEVVELLGRIVGEVNLDG